MVQITLAVGQFFEILIRALFSAAWSVMLVLGLLLLIATGIVLAIRTVLKRLRK